MADIWRDTTALITGASRGIGEAMAELLAGRGVDLVLVARHADALDRVAERVRQAGRKATVLTADLADPEAPARLVAEIADRKLVIDHLVNNAGLGPAGKFHTQAAEEHLPVIDVNVRAVTDLSARLLPGMVQRRRGGLLNIASTAGWQGLVWMPVYSASKAYVITWSEAVWTSLRGSGVRCCCVSPGPVDTGFFDANPSVPKPPGWAMQSAATVARRAIEAYQRDDCHTLTFLPFRLLAWSTRLAPRALASRLGAWYAAPKNRT